ncbi:MULTISPECIES: exopolysaccharide biosynthesis protein [Agrobacterium]|uniref:exopolysaccharide biosynthesis protein n=1 Tax=Agrobacterium TaxID=357 RepID=UPI0009CE9F15
MSLQFAFGLTSLWLPSLLANRHIPVNAFEALQRSATPVVHKIERIVLPDRMPRLAGRRMPYLLALPVFCLAVAIALPIPFGNPAPVVALCVIAIGLVERDGLLVLIGPGMTLIALAVTGALV